MKTGNYDGVSASGDATLRLIAAKDVAPVDFDLIPNYENVFDGLKDQPHNTVDGVSYGVAHGRGANLLIWNTDDVTPAPTTLGRRLGRELAGGREDLGLRQPDLHRGCRAAPEDDAAGPRDRQHLRARRGSVQRCGRPAQAAEEDRRRVLERRREADPVVHERRQHGGHDLAVPGQPAAGREGAGARRGDLPEEGSTGWSDTWMIASTAKNPNCMYLWMDYIISPAANAKATEYFGEAPGLGRGVRADRRQGPLRRSSTPRTRRTSRRSTTGRRRLPTAVTTGVTSARTTRSGRPPGPRSEARARVGDLTGRNRAAAPP